jgi:hypothetical protein
LDPNHEKFIFIKEVKARMPKLGLVPWHMMVEENWWKDLEPFHLA